MPPSFCAPCSVSGVPPGSTSGFRDSRHLAYDRGMGKSYECIGPDLADWIGKQPMFFVATAPLAADGLINCSPKGLDSFRILGPREVAYVDLTGSGIETIAHARENGRIVFMFCAFEGPPTIVRLHGTSEVLAPGMPGFELLAPMFPQYAGSRAIVRARLTRISDSCGYAVPRMQYIGQRDTLVRWADSKGPEGLRQYRAQKNTLSLDRLPGLQAGAAAE
jgi:Pyridoxamine 5'-phosphate oxidase